MKFTPRLALLALTLALLAGRLLAAQPLPPSPVPITFGEEVSVGRRALLLGLCEYYLPRIGQALGSPLPEGPIRFTITEETSAPPGVTLGQEITLSAPFMRRAPEDAGMILHELTHAVQAYPGGTSPSWVVEGVADYVRDYLILPERARQLPLAQADYRKGYTHAAALLHHLIQTRHGGDAAALIHPLNAVCRSGADGEAWLRARYGDLDALCAAAREAAAQ